MEFAIYGTLTLTTGAVAYWFFELVWLVSNGKLKGKMVGPLSEVTVALAIAALFFWTFAAIALWSLQQAWRAF
jgi:hypothetical protein